MPSRCVFLFSNLCQDCFCQWFMQITWLKVKSQPSLPNSIYYLFNVHMQLFEFPCSCFMGPHIFFLILSLDSQVHTLRSYFSSYVSNIIQQSGSVISVSHDSTLLSKVILVNFSATPFFQFFFMSSHTHKYLNILILTYLIL